MFGIQVCIGIITAIGLAFILADVYQLPTLKALKATNNLGKKGDKKVGTIEIWLREFSSFLAGKLKLNEYKRAELEVDLTSAGMEVTPEAYVADALTKAIAIGVFAIPVFFLFKPVSLVIIVLAIVTYFSEYRKVGKKIKRRREEIEYELPRMVSSIEKTVQHNRDPIYILESYKDTAGPEMKRELEITIADMRSGNIVVALDRLESRIGSGLMSDVTRGLAALARGDSNLVYWGQLVIKFSDDQRQKLRQQANAIPGKVRKLSMILLCCFMLIYVAVIGQVLLTSFADLF